ncbi:MAG: HGxxPAAW family protein [Actinomycetes bacterium]|jgi:hypothetical protein|nr:hypothetical protein [Candidatus Nanopelagicales bacterium]MDP4825693.1 hypothetical protein [Candidatus Nanopelagicales bacterium]MDP4888054.1 hypothetical protein [Candidatus Nanopelagicales bacterium]
MAQPPVSGHHDNHGQTPAAWTTVIIITLAFLVGTVGMVIGQWWMFWVGVGMVVLGGIVGKVMAMAGLGMPSHHPTDTHPRG